MRWSMRESRRASPTAAGRLATSCASERHYHAQCRVCGRLEDVPASADGPIRGHAIVPAGFRIEEIHVTMEGRCRRCKERGRPKPASDSLRARAPRATG